jgi:hypothetical protein
LAAVALQRVDDADWAPWDIVQRIDLFLHSREPSLAVMAMAIAKRKVQPHS